MGLLDRLLGRSVPPPMWNTSGTRDADLAGLLPGYATPRLAERVGTAARCLQLVSQQIAAMPLRYRGVAPEPQWTSNPDPVWFPNGVADAMFAGVASMYAWGDAFLLVTSRYQTGFPRSWTVLDPAQVTVEADKRGDGRRYRVSTVDLDPADVLQVSRNPTGALRGTSALHAYAANVKAAYSAEAFAADFFTAGGVPWAVLQPSRRLDEAQAKQLQSQWVARAGLRGGAPAVIPPDVVFTQFSFSPKDLLLLESREWDAKQIAAAHGVPAYLLNMEQSGGLTYANVGMLFDLMWRAELYPSARRIESALSTWLPRGSWVEFDPSVVLKPDLPTMTDTWLKLLTANVVTQDEVRAAVLDLPPLAEGDALELIDEPPGANASVAQPAPPASPPALEVVGGV